jgi:hypothetical protein
MIDLTTLIKDWLDQLGTPLTPIDICRFPNQSTIDGTPIWANETIRIGAIHDTSVRIFKAIDGTKLDIKLNAADPEFFNKLKDALRAVGFYV